MMFSIITMASSTTKPVAMVSAMSERLSRLKPAKYMMPKEAISDSGSVTPATMVALSVRRNKSTTITTRTTLSIERVLHIPHGRADGACAVCDDLRLYARRKRGLKLGQDFLDAVHGADNVRARLALDVDNDSRHAVITRRAPCCFPGPR